MQFQQRLIIRHPRRRAILALGSNRGLALPVFCSGEYHTAEVEFINAAAAELLGLKTIVLESLSISEPLDDWVERVHELEAQAEIPDPIHHTAWQWVEPAEPGQFSAAADQACLKKWLDGAPYAKSAATHPTWVCPGWFEEASRWIGLEVGRVNQIIQLRTWYSSCVLRVETPDDLFYFKAAAPGSIECALTGYLGRYFPAHLPQLMAVQEQRAWLLMRACPGSKLEEIGDIAAWEQAAAGYGGLQAACAERVAELAGLGCAVRGPELLADNLARLADQAHGLTAAESQRLRAILPDLRERCARLASAGIPLTLEHGDLWPGNFFVAANSCRLIDWEDAAISHPFFSLAPLLVGLDYFQHEHYNPGHVERIKTAYLAAFSRFGSSADLGEVLRLALPLSFIDMALRYLDMPAPAVRLHPWMRGLVPEALRSALAWIE